MLAKGDESNENIFLIMEKVRINFTVIDYFDFTGRDPFLSIKDRVLASIPTEFTRIGYYNLKFKVVSDYLYPWNKYYRVHLSLRISKEKLEKEILQRYSRCFGFKNVSYKVITNKF